MGQSVSAMGWVPAAVGALLLGGCAGGQLEPGQVLSPGASRAPTAPLQATSATLGGAARAEFTSTSDGKRLLVHRPAAGAGRGGQEEWTVVRSIADGDGPPKVDSELLFRLEKGDHLLVQTAEHADDVVTQMLPPMLVFPAELPPLTPVKREFKMVVHPAGDPKAVKSEGPASNELVYEADEVIDVPAGRFFARKVRSTLAAQLGKAKVENTTESWYAPGPGLVAERERQRVSIFGVTIRSADRMWVLKSWEPTGR